MQISATLSRATWLQKNFQSFTSIILLNKASNNNGGLVVQCWGCWNTDWKAVGM